ncbi:type II secretion system protein, partial [bacterium]|nr:type II secretion system protein [bacterium]
MKRGFTLTELLLALSIIGIVSALTMSNLFRNTFDKTNVALLQQTYTEVGDAYTQALIENGVRMVADLPMYTTEVDDSVAALILQYYMNGSKCDEDSACFADKYYSDSGNSPAKTFPENIS